MDVFFADLDGTIIRSARKKRAGDIITEYKDGAEISCIAPESAALLPKLGMIPVTSRSMEQYKRIRFPCGFSPKYAVTDNGGNLLINGVPQPDHAKWAAEITKECERELLACRGILENDPDRSFEIRMVDGLFLFTKSERPNETARRLEGAHGGCDFYSTGAKVYVIPKRLNKGAGALRLSERLRAEGCDGRVICAGDSEMDIPLLNIADIAIFPDDLPDDGIKCPLKLTGGRDGFCDFVVKTAAKLMQIQIDNG